ncbi:MAG: two-component system phosphate regulon sensor histidine kinase PhoR [Paracoccaceae bacterium]|jgi:two-component system phosphate regulon sensor histidine kinase PhoR
MTNDLHAEILNGVPVPALLIDQSERIIAANLDALTLLGQQIVERHFATVLRQPPVAEAIEAGLADHKPRLVRHLANDGAQDTTYDVTCRFVPGIGAGQRGAVLVAFQDITPMETARQMRRDFVANVSHELRTPLTALIGFIETLRGAARDDPEARERFLTIMDSEAGRMNRLVGDLLSLNRVENQERERPTEQVDLTAQLRTTLKSLAPLAEKSGVDMVFNAPEVPVIITGDSDQLQQVFANLIENAIKYGGQGKFVGVTLSVSDRDPAVRGPAARVEVADKGAGIDPAHIARLTERFYRADNHRNRELGGTGLGLAIVKHIINRHRGRLRVESDLGQGAVFTVILQL